MTEGRNNSFTKENDFIQECRIKLQSMKQDLIDRMRETLSPIKSFDRSGDEADQTVTLMFENQALNDHQRIKMQLLEIEFALGRIENGGFGICEETGEQIETDRLRALPFTRLSIEGAELRESLQKRAHTKSL